MDCEHAAELLPWLLNGTLEEAEERQVVEHIRNCDLCRQERWRVEDALALLSGHVPAELLVDYALGDALPTEQHRLVERHLAQCPRCAEEAALVSQPPRDVDTPMRVSQEAAAPHSRRTGRPGAPRDSSSWRLAVAAVLAAAIAAAGWLLGSQQLDDERSRWRAREQALEERIATLTSPRLNQAVLELVPSMTEDPLRGAAQPGSGQTNAVKIDPGTEQITLVLLSGRHAADGDHRVELRDAVGDVQWQAEGLTQRPDGLFTLTLPTDLLPDGDSTLQISSLKGDPPAALYRLRVTR